MGPGTPVKSSQRWRSAAASDVKAVKPSGSSRDWAYSESLGQ